ncbi:MAG: heavy metal-binding domain-containing protein [Chthoniobacteraceae bacterium]
MKTIKVLTMMLVGAMLAAAPLRAEEPAAAPAKGMKCASPKKEDDAKKPEMKKMMQAMEAKMKAMEARKKAEAEEFDKLISEMNASIGDRKTEAMAAVINKMAQKQKEMSAKCDTMMKGMMKKDSNAGAKPAELDYYTCTMHPAVHWPVPGKCPICSMELVPVFKKDAGATPEAKPGEEPKKAADPHAAHH